MEAASLFIFRSFTFKQNTEEQKREKNSGCATKPSGVEKAPICGGRENEREDQREREKTRALKGLMGKRTVLLLLLLQFDFVCEWQLGGGERMKLLFWSAAAAAVGITAGCFWGIIRTLQKMTGEEEESQANPLRTWVLSFYVAGRENCFAMNFFHLYFFNIVH